MDILKIRQLAKDKRAQREGEPSRAPATPAVSTPKDPAPAETAPVAASSPAPSPAPSAREGAQDPAAAPSAHDVPARDASTPPASVRSPSKPSVSESSPLDPSPLVPHAPVPATPARAPTRDAIDPSALRDVDPLGEFLARYDEGDVELSGEGDAPDVAASRRYLTFDLEKELYAASIQDVREILKMVTVTPVPRAPDGVLGVISKRGMVLPVIDLASRLGLRPTETSVDREQRVLVAGEGRRVCGLKVDRVHGVVVLKPEDIDPVPSGVKVRSAAVLSGLGRSDGGFYILLDLHALLSFMQGELDDDDEPEVA